MQDQDDEDLKHDMNALRDMETGNYLGAVKERLKNKKVQKAIKKKITIFLLILVLVVAIVMTIVNSITSIFDKIKDTMVNLLESISPISGKNYFSKAWQKFTGDYWVDIGDENSQMEYIIDTATGKTIAYINDEGEKIIFNKSDLSDLAEKEYNKTVYQLEKNEIIELTNKFLSGKSTVTQKYSLIDIYTKQLGDQGITLKGLRIGGNADYTNKDKIIESENENPLNEQIVEKYISEFLRADIITQQLHRRKEDGVVNTHNQDKVDGGIYLYRKNEDSEIELDEVDLNNAYNTSNSQKSNCLFIGDSRTIDMFADSDAELQGKNVDNVTVYAKHGYGFDYMSSKVSEYGYDNFDTLVTWMGANDAGDFSQYESFYNGILSAGKNLILCTVGPTDDLTLDPGDRPNYDNDKMIQFNDSLKNWASNNNVQVIDLYSFINGNIQIDSSDGIHYSPRPTTSIWNNIVTSLDAMGISREIKANTEPQTTQTKATVTNEYIGENVEVEVDATNLIRMKYILPEDFLSKLKVSGEDISVAIGQTYTVTEAVAKDLKYSFTENVDNGTVVLVEIIKKEKQTLESQELGHSFLFLEPLLNWMKDKGAPKIVETEYQVRVMELDYKQLVAKYAMPYEFLINLTEITQNPEFAYHVALIARDTEINLIVQDNQTIEIEAVLDQYTQYTHYSGTSRTDYSKPSITDRKDQNEAMQMTKTDTPILQIKSADAWSYYDEFIHTKNIEVTEEVTTEVLTLAPGLLDPDLDEQTKEPTGTYSGTFPTVDERTTAIYNIQTVFNDSELDKTKSVEKSKQFLGLLRNTEGKCPVDCYTQLDLKTNDPKALECTKQAIFDEDGTNILYRIPGQDIKNPALNYLQSGIELLYSNLLSNNRGRTDSKAQSQVLTVDENSYNQEKELIQQGKATSAYVIKMQSIVEHLRYLMTFPLNEIYEPFRLTASVYEGYLQWNGGVEDYENYKPQYTWDGTSNEFIEMMGKYARMDMQESGILASVTVAQAIIESGWGKSGLAAKYNNFFGIKAGGSWSGPTATLRTREEDENGNSYYIYAKFRAYDSPLDSVKDHSKILKAKRYNGVVGEKDYVKAITIIKNGGYATDGSYIKTICGVIEKYGLTRFDKPIETPANTSVE